jgi:flagellar hook-associated protein 1 FlgK
MAGISHVLNLAKEALVTHQLAISVTGHNVANVNTPGYSRQTLGLTTPTASPAGIGYIGNGVRASQVERNYDRFMVQRLVDQESKLSNLEAQNMSMRIVETAFNEAPGMAINDLLSQFWSGWQDLAANPEFISSRQTVVQQANLINQQLQMMAAEIAQSRQDISSNLQAAVNDVNALTEQIAGLNLQITTGESDISKQNDLRDQRDELVKELGQFVDINYFEMGTGAYTILLKDGHSLVENNQAWSVKWDDRNLNWQTTNSNGQVTLSVIGDGSSEALGGKMGGWMKVHNQLIEGEPENYLGRLDALANSLIREVNQAHTQGVGLERFSDLVSSATVAADTTRLQSTVETSTALEDIVAGTITINDREVGHIEGALAVNGLAMGKTANTVDAINNALSDVKARLTTLVAGDAVSTAAPLAAGDVMDFTVNDVAVAYTVTAADVADPAVFAANMVGAINTAITAYNSAAGPANVPKATLTAEVGTGANGGVLNSLVLRNTNPGDESQITLAGLDGATSEANLGLTNDSYGADASHNTGELTLFNHRGNINIDAGSTDTYLTHLGLDGGTFGVYDVAGDGKIDFEYADGGVGAAMMGYAYSDELVTDGGSFQIWLYNSDDTLALPQPVEVPLDRAYTLQDVANAINTSIEQASSMSPNPWLRATVEGNKLMLTPDADHSFAFGNDTSNFLATAGLNTFFTGHSAATIGVNSQVADSLEFLAAGQVTPYGEIFAGDDSNALLITNIQRREDVRFYGSSNNTLDGHYNSLVAAVGLESRSVARDFDYNTLITNQMREMRDATSGVNLDEEMANLIKFQHAYTAAAKLITTSDEMLQTLLASVNR